MIIDMQQWYKADVTQRFYLYHALNTGLQTEDLPKKRIVPDKTSKQIVRVKDYRAFPCSYLRLSAEICVPQIISKREP